MASRYPSSSGPQYGWDYADWHTGASCDVALHQLGPQTILQCRTCRCFVPIGNAAIRIDPDLAFEPREATA